MRDVLLVAMREIRQILATKGFWVMLLIGPIALAGFSIAGSALGPERSNAFSIADRTGRYAEAIEARMEAGYQQQVLRDLSIYVLRLDLAGVDPQAPWANPQAWLVPSEVERFVAAGGAEAAVETLRPHLPTGAEEFEIEDRSYVLTDLPQEAVLDEGGEAFGASIEQALQGDITLGEREIPYTAALYIPDNFGEPGVTAQIWSSGRPDRGLQTNLREELTALFRQEALQASGLDPQTAAQMEVLQAPVALHEPPPGEGRELFATQSLIPIALVYLLLITGVTTGSMLLQGVVEERSDKLVESVLACISPDALMRGKLLGLGGVGLCIMAVWGGCAVVAVLVFQGPAMELLGPSIEAIDSAWMVLAMIFYFLSGYLVFSMVFLAIGAVSDSMQDAQAFLTPVLIAMMLPVMLVMQAAFSDPDGLIVQIFSWIPLYTPFAMLARLGTGVSLVEVLGTGVVLLVFLYLQLLFLGRLFRASILSGGKPSWRTILANLKAAKA